MGRILARRPDLRILVFVLPLFGRVGPVGALQSYRLWFKSQLGPFVALAKWLNPSGAVKWG